MRTKVGEYERLVEWTPAFDKRSADPTRNYGVHGMNLRFVLIGPRGAAHFLLYTAFHLRGVRRYLDDHEQPWNGTYKPLPCDLGAHSRVPMYEGQEVATTGDCEYIGGPCYSDGSTTHADAAFDAFVERGEEALWEVLEWTYRARCCGEEVPELSAFLSAGWENTRSEFFAAPSSASGGGGA
jgi:hypothetical protein